MSHAEDDDHTTFIGLQNEAGERTAVLSRAAFQLHSFAMVESVRAGTPGFISDQYLNAIAAETTITAAELCTAGMWQRGTGGYVLRDHLGLLDGLTEQVKWDREEQMRCVASGGHFADARERCTNCGVSIGGPNDHTAVIDED